MILYFPNEVNAKRWIKSKKSKDVTCTIRKIKLRDSPVKIYYITSYAYLGKRITKLEKATLSILTILKSNKERRK